MSHNGVGWGKQTKIGVTLALESVRGDLGGEGQAESGAAGPAALGSRPDPHSRTASQTPHYTGRGTRTCYAFPSSLSLFFKENIEVKLPLLFFLF